MSREDQTATGRLQELQGVENKIILRKFFSSERNCCIGERSKTSDYTFCSKSPGSLKPSEKTLRTGDRTQNKIQMASQTYRDQKVRMDFGTTAHLLRGLTAPWQTDRQGCTAPALLQHQGQQSFPPLCRGPAVHRMGIQAESLEALLQLSRTRTDRKCLSR